MSHVLVICARKYNGHELWTALGIIQRRGHTFDLASIKTVIEDEVTGERNRIKLTIDDVTDSMFGKFEDKYDAFMVVSGNMALTEAYWTDKRVLSIIDVFEQQQKPIAAICCSVPTIRHVAKGKKVSFFPLVRSRMLLLDAGAILQTVALTRDQNLVTAEHQMASEMWAEEFCNLIEDLPTEFILFDSGYIPRGRERKPIPEVQRLQEALNNVRNSKEVAEEVTEADKEAEGEVDGASQ